MNSRVAKDMKTLPTANPLAKCKAAIKIHLKPAEPQNDFEARNIRRFKRDKVIIIITDCAIIVIHVKEK